MFPAFGLCGIAVCGACTLYLDGVPTRSWVRPVSTVGPDEKIVTIEGLSPDGSHPTPDQNLARNRAWGNFGTGGSRAIRESQDYVRKGGAAARMMLVQAAADLRKVPVAECKAASSVITHTRWACRWRRRPCGRDAARARLLMMGRCPCFFSARAGHAVSRWSK